ncbi:ECF transporter S component [Ornithinimicrobium cavernae]|uniref:ECF transporter S component n=1 Tax=Ornithinimicrobium cavernae TaxID=2666047 RepID=UPI000D69D50F|nr:ECF transporter S component [Ornithinimicrobium cavernae]
MSASSLRVPSATGRNARVAAVRIGPRSALAITLVSVIGLAMFLWPLFISAEPTLVQHTVDAPFVFMAILPALVLIVLAEISEGGMDAKALAMLGVLSAVTAALRPLGAGTAGIEVVFFIMVLAGRVFGPGFGFVLGCTSMFASALLTAGVGPWLPFQMLTSAWIGLFAGLLPRRVSGRWEIAMLAVYGVVAAYVFGALMNMWFWPFVTGVQVSGVEGALGYEPGAPVLENLHRFLVFTLFTSTLGWDTGRAVTNAVLIVLIGPALLATLRRASRRASFGVRGTFGTRDTGGAWRTNRHTGARGDTNRLTGAPAGTNRHTGAPGDTSVTSPSQGL